MSHRRLFVALRPPASVRAALLGIGGGLPGARWQDDDQLHCTIRFIGEVDRHVAADIVATLAGVRAAPIDATLDDVGSFSSRGRVSSLWVGLRPVSALSALHAKVGRALMHAGIPPDPRAFQPHVTIARFSRRDAPSVDVTQRIPPPPALTMRFDRLILFESILGAEGATYRPMETFDLDAPAAL